MSNWSRNLRGLGAAALLLAMTAVPMPAAAASCLGKSHQASLTSGGVTPGSGDTSTVYKFKVTYSDNAGCVPASVTLNVSGVGDFAMAANGGSGTSYQAQTRLPVGTFSYAFTAISGSGPGTLEVTLTSVSPSKIKVVAEPKPTATPKPTAKPTAKPARAATPAPTPVPVPSAASVAPTVPPTVSGEPTAPPTSRATPTPRAVAAVGGSLPGGPTAGFTLPNPDLSLPWLIAWLVATAGGLVLFFTLGRGPQLSVAPAGDAPPEVAPSGSAPAAARSRSPRSDESQLPRWLRPSVQAARYATPGRGTSPRADD